VRRRCGRPGRLFQREPRPNRGVKRFGATGKAGFGARRGNLHFQVEPALERYSDRVKAGKLTVLGAIFDFANVYGKDFGTLLLAKVNGFKTVEEIVNNLPEGEREEIKAVFEKLFI
jgi:carbonic anhydrase